MVVDPEEALADGSPAIAFRGIKPNTVHDRIIASNRFTNISPYKLTMEHSAPLFGSITDFVCGTQAPLLMIVLDSRLRQFALPEVPAIRDVVRWRLQQGL